MLHLYKDTEENNPKKVCKVLIVFDDVIADITSSKEFQ